MHKRIINGKKFDMPDGWHDVSFKNGIRIIKENMNEMQIFSMFSNIPLKEIRELNSSNDIYYYLQGFPFLRTLPVSDNPQIPRSVKYKGERYSFPHVLLNDEYDFGNTSVGQIEDMKAIIAKMNKEFIKDEDRVLTNLEVFEIYSYVVAIYLQPIIEKNYSYARAMRMVEFIENELSFKEVMNMGAFFLTKLTHSINGYQKALRLPNWITKRLRRVQRSLVKHLDSMQH
jgi:hypothetical protein